MGLARRGGAGAHLRPAHRSPLHAQGMRRSPDNTPFNCKHSEATLPYEGEGLSLGRRQRALACAAPPRLFPHLTYVDMDCLATMHLDIDLVICHPTSHSSRLARYINAC